MGKKKKEHVTFDRMADKRIRLNKNDFIKKKIKKVYVNKTTSLENEE